VIPYFFIDTCSFLLTWENAGRGELRPLISLATAGDQVVDKNNDGDDQQNVDQAASYVKAEAEQPQNQEKYENRPEHESSLAQLCAFETPARQIRLAFLHAVESFWVDAALS
jgi:hypothetical protein